MCRDCANFSFQSDFFFLFAWENAASGVAEMREMRQWLD